MLTIEQLRTRTVGIIGFGKEGQAVARFLKRHHMTAVVFDDQALSQFPEDLVREYQAVGFEFRCGEPIADMRNVEVVFRSPGFRRLHPVLRAAEAGGLIVTSQTKWFLEHCPSPVIGVTGTKGKGTTVSLIARCLETAVAQGGVGNDIEPNAAIFVTGNIGTVDPLDLLDTLEPKDFVVFELSSFQLQDVTTSPHISVCLMVTSEHLDHHKSLEEYHAAKAPIASYQDSADVVVYAEDYEISRRIGRLSKGVRMEIVVIVHTHKPA
jgi:UDP-N-acetylmuramoylalanine--D-glutamate ligase